MLRNTPEPMVEPRRLVPAAAGPSPAPCAAETEPRPNARFPTTHWSTVSSAGRNGEGGSHTHVALEKICRIYWYPLYAFVRRRGFGPEDAQDLTQAFFARLIEKDYVGQAERQRGKFRTFLLSALNHFLADEWDRAHRQKRNKGQAPVSLDALTAEERYRLEPVDGLDAAKLYERRWATTLLEHTLERLEREFSEGGRDAAFATLKPFLLGGMVEGTYAQAAARLGTTGAALKMAVSRMRMRCRELLREEISLTADTPQAAEEEYHALLNAFRK